MGRPYKAIVFIGYKIKKDKLTKFETIEKVIKKFCLCKENNEQNIFCPKCGNKNVRTVNETKVINYLSEYGIYDPYEAYGQKNEDVYVIIESVRKASGNEHEPFNSGLKGLTVDENTKTNFIQKVNEIDLWNEDNYGLYTFVECSY